MPNRFLIYTDGSCRYKDDGAGGWAYAIVVYKRGFRRISKKLIHNNSDGVENTTNNRMEMLAAIKALEFFRKKYPTLPNTCMLSDSSYLVVGITEHIFNWLENDWVTSNGYGVKNRDLWEELLALVSDFYLLNWKWLPGHEGNKYNEYVDRLAGVESAAIAGVTVGPASFRAGF